MGDLFVYILKSSLCLAVFYLFYKLMLSKETFHKFNRIVLLTLFILSLIIPFIEITLHKATPYTGMTLNFEALLSMAQSSDLATDNVPDSNKWLVYILVAYLSGFIASAIKALFSFLKMFSFIRSAKAERKTLENNIMLVIHKKPIAPFSWMKYIVVSEKDYQESGREIITHEVAHIAKYHSADLLLAEAVKILHWFNPAAYLLKQELQNIHEYQADEAVINNGIDAKQYQLLLIKKAVGARLYSMANSFNHSKLKNRITMISKKKSTRSAALKALFVLPLTAFAIVAFASQEVTSKMEVISSTKITDFIQNDTIKKVSVKNDSKDGIIKIRVSTITTCLGDSLKYVIYSGEKKEPLVFIDDVETNSDIIKTLDSTKIKTVVVYKGDKAIEKYGPQAKNGVIIVTTQNCENVKEKACENVIVRLNNGGLNPLYVIDGVEQKDSLYVKTLSPESINAINILKDEAAVKKYGEKAKNGVIEITLKEEGSSVKKAGQTQKSGSNIIIRSIGSYDKITALIVVDGKIMDTGFKIESITPEIESVTVFKDSANVKQYGERGKNGVILITLKKK